MTKWVYNYRSVKIEFNEVFVPPLGGMEIVMEYLGVAIGIVVALIVVILIIRFIVFLFTNFFISRLFSIGTAIASLMVAFSLVEATGEKRTECLFMAIIFTSLSWLFLIGPVVFDVRWDGSWDWRETATGWNVRPRMTGGFIGNALGALAFSAGIYFFIGSSTGVVFFLLPLLLLLGNLIYIFARFR